MIELNNLLFSDHTFTITQITPMIHVPFSHSQLFPNKVQPKIDELLKDIPSRIVLIVLSYINHHLYLGTPEKGIYEFLSKNWPHKVKYGILRVLRRMKPT